MHHSEPLLQQRAGTEHSFATGDFPLGKVCAFSLLPGSAQLFSPSCSALGDSTLFYKMANPQLCLGLMALALLLTVFDLQGVSGDSLALHKILKRSDGSEDSVGVSPSRALQFLVKLNRPKRQVWDRSRPDVQQWIQQFMLMGFDEQRLEADLSYWMDHARANDQGRQHHYDENSPVGPRDHTSYRHGANVNYDYY